MAKIDPIICSGCNVPIKELYHLDSGEFQCMTVGCGEPSDVITTDELIRHIYEQLLK